MPDPGHPSPVSAAYAALAAAGTITDDPDQRAAAAVLDVIANGLTRSRRSFLSSVFGAPPAPVKGAYLVGDVGRGKTLLMDLFFASVQTAQKRRVHFDEFMAEIHAAIAVFRAGDKTGGSDPVAAVVAPIVAQTRLLCLDEFQVGDITNAMLLGRLFEKLFAAGVVLVATSNVEPERLYWNGLNRDLFTPFIAMLEAHTQLVRLDGAQDYRRLKFAGQDVYVFGTGPDASRQLDRLWQRLTGGAEDHEDSFTSLGRVIRVPRAAMGAARFGFAQLCDAPLAAADYGKLSARYDALVLDDIPVFDRARSNAAKRFILLIDTLYDRGVKFAGSFAAPLEELAADDRTAFEFARTVSRLIEMRSETYLNAPRRSPVSA